MITDYYEVLIRGEWEHEMSCPAGRNHHPLDLNRAKPVVCLAISDTPLVTEEESVEMCTEDEPRDLRAVGDHHGASAQSRLVG